MWTLCMLFNIAIVDNMDRTNGARSSFGKVYNVNKEDKEEKVYRRNINHFSKRK